MTETHMQIILGALGVAVALAFIIPAMFGTPAEDEYYSALSEWEEEWQTRRAAQKQRRLFQDTKPL